MASGPSAKALDQATNAVRRERKRNFPAVPRIEGLRVRNFRALKAVAFKQLTPMTVLIGPNGCGKSTVFDVFAFLADCFDIGLRRAWDKRGGAKELVTRGSTGPVDIQIKYREPGQSVFTYRIVIAEDAGRPVVAHEVLSAGTGKTPGATRLLDFKHGAGSVNSGTDPADQSLRLSAPDILAVNALGQLASHPRVVALRDFITCWQISCLTVGETRGPSTGETPERLNATGSNLAHVLQYLEHQHPAVLQAIYAELRRMIPRFDRAIVEATSDGRLQVKIRDLGVDRPIEARFVSDGTLMLLAHLVMLRDPTPPPFLGIEEPENFLHHRLLVELAEEFRGAAAFTQMLITTHSPFFLNSLRPEEVRVLWRDVQGHTQAACASDIEGVAQFLHHGALLGDLWTEGFFRIGDPLVDSDPEVLSVSGR